MPRNPRSSRDGRVVTQNFQPLAPSGTNFIVLILNFNLLSLGVIFILEKLRTTLTLCARQAPQGRQFEPKSTASRAQRVNFKKTYTYLPMSPKRLRERPGPFGRRCSACEEGSTNGRKLRGGWPDARTLFGIAGDYRAELIEELCERANRRPRLRSRFQLNRALNAPARLIPGKKARDAGRRGGGVKVDRHRAGGAQLFFQIVYLRCPRVTSTAPLVIDIFPFQINMDPRRGGANIFPRKESGIFCV